MFTRLIFSTLILCFSITSYGQEKKLIQGRVVDESGLPVNDAHIQLVGTKVGTTTDSRGTFKLSDIPGNQLRLIVTHLGHHQEEVVLGGSSTEEISITLKEDKQLLSQVYIIDSRSYLFSKTPGSVAFLDQAELERIKPLTGNEVFRKIPGLHIVDEEGVGLRVNIGIRGLDPDRSRNVLMMEDGIPVALSPYAEPEMYYTPAIDRMSGIEVLKGSGQLEYGPQTVGGVINYITSNPPESEEFGFRLQGGKGGYLSLMGSYGNTFNSTGVHINYLHKQADAVGPTNFTINDVTTKIRFPLSEKSTFGVKLAAYNEVSNSTYVGITQRMFDMGGNDYSVLTPDDELAVARYLLSLSHTTEFSSSLSLQSMLYAYATTRNWRRQDYAHNTFTAGSPNPPPSDWTGVAWGDETVPGGAIYLRNRTGNRNRQFEVLGWEQKIKYTVNLGTLPNHILAGYRFMHEKAYEQRVNGSNASAKSGALINDEVRTGNAFAFYILDKISLSKKLDVTPGIRGEFYSYEREIMRESGNDVNKTAHNAIHEFIPGVGINFRPSTSVNLFTGIHKGYAPPRIKDAIDFSLGNPVLDLKAENSWNFELGLRTQIQNGLYAEATYFHMDFDNQIIPSSQSIGGSGFGVTNAGRTLHRGLEVTVNVNSRELLNTKWLFLFDANTTYTRATYNSDRLVPDGSENINIRGNRLPYAPQSTFTAAMTIESPFGTGFRISNTSISSQFTDEVNSKLPSNNGRLGEIPSYSIVDATLYHNVSSIGASFKLCVKNLMDERYITTRRPEGIRVGIPRFITAGVELKF